MIYTLIHGRDPIPCRTTYIEYRSPMKIFIIIFWGRPPNSIGFHCKIFFFHSSTTPVVGGTKIGGCSNPCIWQKPEQKYFPGSKWIAGNILCIGFFFDSGRCFYSMYRFFLPIPEDAFRGRNYRFCILCMPSWLYIYYTYTHVSNARWFWCFGNVTRIPFSSAALPRGFAETAPGCVWSAGMSLSSCLGLNDLNAGSTSSQKRKVFLDCLQLTCLQHLQHLAAVLAYSCDPIPFGWQS